MMRKVGLLFLFGLSLCGVLAGSLGCGAASVQQLESDRSAPGVLDAPLFERLLGEPLDPGTMGEKAAGLVGDADRAAREGKAAQAYLKLERAVEVLRSDAPACRTRGAVLYLRGLLAGMAHDVSDTNGWNELRTTCTEAAVGEEESGYRTFLTYMVPHAGGAEKEGVPWDWMQHPRLVDEPAVAKLEAAGKRLPGRQGEILRAAAAWIRADHMDTDDPCHPSFEEDRRGAFKAAFERFEKAGRSDLGLYWRYMALVDKNRRLDLEGIASFWKWVSLQENRWLRSQALSGALQFIRTEVEWSDPLLTIPLCSAYLDQLRQDVAHDRGAGFCNRNAERMFEVLSQADICFDSAGLSELVDDVFTAASESPHGRAGVLEIMFGTVVRIVPAVLSGDSPVGASGIIGHLVGGALRYRGKLGDSAEDRALDATLRVLVSLPALMSGQVPHALEEMKAAADVFDNLAAGKSGNDSPTMIRLVPGLRAGTLVLLTALHYVLGMPDEAVKSQARLDKNLESDLASLLAYLEAPDHSIALARLIRAAPVVAIALFVKSPATLKQTWAMLETASEQGKGEKGWWTVGLDGGRCLLWGVMAVAAFSGGDAVKGREAVDRGAVINTRLVDHALEYFQLQKTGFELLTVLPHLHKALPGVLEKKMEAPQIAATLAMAMNEPLKQAWARVDRSSPGLFIDLTDIVVDTGLDRLVREPRKARSHMVDLIRKKAARQPAGIRVLFETVAGRLQDDPQAAQDAYLKAEEAIQKSRLTSVTYFPKLMQASQAFMDRDDLDGALAALDGALAEGERGLACGKKHVAYSLLPFKTWALEVKGRHPEAVKTYERYATLVRKGFTGDASVNFRLRSHRGSFVLNLTIARNIAAGFFFDSKPEGTFSLGMGYDGSHSMLGAQDIMRSYTRASKDPRLDKIIMAHLARAVYAFRQGEEREAHRALLAAVSAGRLMMYGTSRGLSREARGQAKWKLSLPLIAWTTCLARLRGHVHVADQLDRIARAAAPWQGIKEEDALPIGDELPDYLGRLKDLRPHVPLVQAWHRSRDQKGLQILSRLLRKLSGKGSLIPDWGARMALAELRPKKVKRLKAPRDPVGGAVVKARNLLVKARTKKNLPKPESIERIVLALARAGLYGEIGGLASSLHEIADKGGKPDQARKVLEAALKHIPEDEAPLVRGELLALKKQPALKDLTEMVPAIVGRVEAHIERTQRTRLFRLLVEAGRFDDLKGCISLLQQAFARSLGTSSTQFHNLLPVDIALRARKGWVDLEVVRKLAKLASGIKGAEEVKPFLDDLADAKNLGAAKVASEKFLTTVFEQKPTPKPD